MPRATRSVQKRARHKKWLKRAKGYRGRRSKVFKIAKEATLKAGQYAYRDRRKKKAQFRQAWQVTINAASRQHGLSYSRFVHGLRTQNIQLNRKVLSQIAKEQPETFRHIAEKVQEKS